MDEFEWRVQMGELHAEVERLRAEVSWPRLQEATAEIERLRHENTVLRKANYAGTEAAAFLDGLANKLDGWSTYHAETAFAAAECRAMAKRLRT
jgi:hypothetical protein